MIGLAVGSLEMNGFHSCTSSVDRMTTTSSFLSVDPEDFRISEDKIG